MRLTIERIGKVYKGGATALVASGKAVFASKENATWDKLLRRWKFHRRPPTSSPC